MQNKSKRPQQRLTKLKADSLRRYIKLTNHYQYSSRKKRRRIKSTKLEMKWKNHNRQHRNTKDH